MTKLRRINYADLKARQKENYNFQKLAARLADYGFFCQRLHDDWFHELERIDAPTLKTESWKSGGYDWPTQPRWAQEWLEQWKL